MQTLNTHNKMVDLNTETKLRINQPIHGYVKGQEVRYSHQTPEKQLLLRRRMADGDGSVEIVDAVTAKPKQPPIVKPTIKPTDKPKSGSMGSDKQLSGDK